MWWDIPGWDGQTVRDRTANLGIPAPDDRPPEYGREYVGWFWGLRRFLNGHEEAIKPGLVKDWREYSGVSLSRREEGIIYAMDAAFRSMMPKAIAHHEKRRKDQQ